MGLLDLAKERGYNYSDCLHRYQTLCRWERKDGREFAAYQCDDCGQLLAADDGEWKDYASLPGYDREAYLERQAAITAKLFPITEK